MMKRKNKGKKTFRNKKKFWKEKWKERKIKKKKRFWKKIK